jgi:hypothetical protein
MPYDSTLPVDHSPIVAAELRAQFNGLKALIDAQAALIDAQQAQLAPLTPQLVRDGTGMWTVAYAGPAAALWQAWVRSDLNPNWAAAGEYALADFPGTDTGLMPAGATWWQVKVCGKDGSDANLTPFSNVTSFGPVP